MDPIRIKIKRHILTVIIELSIVTILVATSCYSFQNQTELFDNQSLEDSLSVYLTGMRDMENGVNNPMVTYIRVFQRNDSLITTFDSQPDNYRILLPGRDYGDSPKTEKTCHGFFRGRIVSLGVERDKLKHIDSRAIKRFTKREEEAYKQMPTSSCFGWGKDKYYREYYVDKDRVVLLKSYSPLYSDTIPSVPAFDEITGLEVYPCTSVLAAPLCNGLRCDKGFGQEFNRLLSNKVEDGRIPYNSYEVQYVVDTKGNLIGPRIRGKCPGALNPEERYVLSIVDKIQNWKPGVVGGKPVNVLINDIVYMHE